MKVGEHRTVIARAGTIIAASDPSFTESSPGEGPWTERPVEVGAQVIATLDGPAFKIARLGDPSDGLRPLGHETHAEWRWDVKPTSAGRHTLTLTLSAFHPDIVGPIKSKTYVEHIRVTVDKKATAQQWFSKGLGTFGNAFIVAVSTALAAAAIAQVKRRRRQDDSVPARPNASVSATPNVMTTGSPEVPPRQGDRAPSNHP
jgi:hypothetical protein